MLRLTACFGQVEIATDYVRKGELIGVSGKLSFDTWNDRNTGELRVKPVICDRLELLGAGKREEVAA